MKINKFFLIGLLVFFVSRGYILLHPPKDYSDVSHFYERYANMWRYGLPPYFKHLFEYPPAAVPLISLPLTIDQAGFGYYYFNYRLETFLIEFLLYIFILITLSKTFPMGWRRNAAIAFYCLAPLIAKDFWYEGIDIAFGASLTLALVSFFLFKKQRFCHKVIFWALFWLSTAIKFVTLPLCLPFFIIKNKNIKKSFKNELLACILGFILIWGAPLAIFRSSLSVAIYFHAKRPLHGSSFPAFIVETVNRFTHSETYRDLEWFGPLTQKALFLSFVFLFINTFLVIGWALIKKLKDKKISPYVLMLKTSLIYLIAFMIAGKIISPPFHIWYLGLLAIFPYKDKKTQLSFFLIAVTSLIFNTTNIVKLSEKIMIYPFTWQFLRHLFRFPPLLALAFLISGNMEEENAKFLVQQKRK